jgi:hypothetical protein
MMRTTMLSRASSNPIDISLNSGGEGQGFSVPAFVGAPATFEHPLGLLDISFGALVGGVIL